MQRPGDNMIFQSCTKTRYPGDWHLNMTDELYSMTGCHLIPYSTQWQIPAAVKSGLQCVHDYI